MGTQPPPVFGTADSEALGLLENRSAHPKALRGEDERRREQNCKGIGNKSSRSMQGNIGEATPKIKKAAERRCENVGFYLD
jgi:hypothetical protein